MNCCKITIIIEGGCCHMASTTGSYSMHVDPASANPLTLTPPSGALTGGVVGTPIATEEVTVVSGGTPPYTFAVSSGAVPDGLSLSSVENADGTETVNLEGTPTTAGDFSFDLMVTDAAAAKVKTTVSSKKKIG